MTKNRYTRWAIDKPDPKDFKEMKGGKIAKVRFHRKEGDDTLIIDYVKDGEKLRAVFGSNNFGLWGSLGE